MAQYRAMRLDLAVIVAHAPAIIGVVGGTVGIISGLAVFARRRLRLVVTITQNNDAHDSWYTINIANRSDLSVSYRDAAVGWFIFTPLGRLYLNWAYCPEEETNVRTIGPHGTETMRVRVEDWELARPKDRQESAYLRMYLHLPARGSGVWLPVRWSTWKDGTLRERLLRRLYAKREPSEFDDLFAVAPPEGDRASRSLRT